MLIAEVIKTRTKTRAMMTKMIMMTTTKEMTMTMRMMKTAMLRMFTSEVVAPGGKEGELWGSEGLGPGEILNAAFDHQDDDDGDNADDVDDGNGDNDDDDDDPSQVNQHWS